MKFASSKLPARTGLETTKRRNSFGELEEEWGVDLDATLSTLGVRTREVCLSQKMIQERNSLQVEVGNGASQRVFARSSGG